MILMHGPYVLTYEFNLIFYLINGLASHDSCTSLPHIYFMHITHIVNLYKVLIHASLPKLNHNIGVDDLPTSFTRG